MPKLLVDESMGSLSKNFALILILIIAISSLSLLMVKPAIAQSIPEPTVPQFTVNWVNTSSDNESIVITITNQNFTSFIDNVNGVPWNISLFYDVRVKTHYAENWTDIYYPTAPIASSSQFTIITAYITHYSNGPEYFILGSRTFPVTTGTQLDFQVEALTGYIHRIAINPFAPWIFNGTESGWSNTQTISIPASSTSPTPTPTVPEFPPLTITPFLIFFVFAGLVVYFKKHNRRET